MLILCEPLAWKSVLSLLTIEWKVANLDALLIVGFFRGFFFFR